MKNIHHAWKELYQKAEPKDYSTSSFLIWKGNKEYLLTILESSIVRKSKSPALTSITN